MPKVTHITVAVVTKDFNPEKYKTLCRILCSKLLQTGSPASMLQSYLSVFTKGSCKDDDDHDNEDFSVKEYDPRKAFIEKSIKDVVNIFGVETILIYTALLLKKRIAVYSPRLETLLEISSK
ncbi:Protein FAM45A [Exaiptasia diaphana]|nr:Protein FAM45A [Exaiptasia diaphana]